MKIKALPTLLSLAASIMLCPIANAAGMIVVDPINGAMPVVRPVVRPGGIVVRPGSRPLLLKGQVSFGLRLESADIRVEINDQVAKTYITQTFANDTDRNLAGTYLFPLPEDTTFSSFSLHIDGKPVEGKILEANEARQQYETIVRQMIDPGLLEYADYKTVRARIFPIPAHGTKKVELEYTQVLKAENGMIKYSFPLKTEGDDQVPAEEVKINVKLASKQGLRTIWSPSHMISSKREGDHKATASFLGKDFVPDKDFLMYYSVSDKDMTANLLTHKTAGEDGYFLMTLTPPVQAKEIVSKDIVFVADISGSMMGKRMEENKRALKYLVNALNPSDHFSVVQFNTDVDAYKNTLVQATPENKKAAIAFINDMEAAGGTNIGDALKTAGSMLGTNKERPSYLVMMTDGEPTVGETSVAGLLKAIDPKKDIRVFDFGVGYDVNTKLLNKLADDNHGTSQYVEPEESMEVALSTFYDKIKSPVLSNVKLNFEGITVKDMYPRNVKDIFAGSQLLLMGKYKASGSATCKMTGTINGVAKAYSFPLKFEEQSVGHSYLPRLWAMRRIAHLTDVAQNNGENKEVIDEIIALSKKYGIISNYTSFLVTEPSENHRLPQPTTGMPVPQATGAQSNVRGRMLNRLSNAQRAVAPAFGGGGGSGGVGWDAGSANVKASSADSLDGPSGFNSAGEESSAKISTRTLSSSALSKQKAGWSSGARELQIADKRPSVSDARAGQNYSLPTAPSAPAATYGSFHSSKPEAVSGKEAVMYAKKMNTMKDSVALDENKTRRDLNDIKSVDDKTFYLRGGYWVDGSYDSFKSPKAKEITFGSKEYFELLKSNPGISKYLSVGRQVILVFHGQTFKISFKQEA